jgi:hypothetical protein
VVSVAGTTNLNGITDWLVGDWAVYNGTAWQKVDNTDSVTSVNGLTGAVSLTTTNIAEGTNLYYTDVRARASNSAGTGISYDSATGVITNAAPDQTVALTDGTAIDVTGTYPNFTINNTAPDQIVALTGAGTTTVSGTYPNFTITSADSKVGDVVGPASATDNAIARYDTTTGKLIQNSLVIVDDTGSVTGVNALTAQSLTVNNNATLGSSNTDSLDVRARISSDLDPETNNAKDIGSSGRNWRDGFFGRTVHTVNLELTGTTSFDGAQGTSGQVLTSAGTGNTPTWTTPTTGTVTSVDATAGTGISVSGGPITTSGSLTITNTAPDQVVSLTGAGTTSISGTYPNFTISSDDQFDGTVTSVGGTGTVNGITLTGTVTSSGSLSLGGTLSGVSLSTQVTGTLPIANGGTGETTRQAAIDALAGAVTSGQYLRGNGTDVVMSAIQAGDVPTLNQDTTGTAAKANALNSATTVVNVSSSAAPSAGQVLTATSGTAATWQTPASGGVSSFSAGTTGFTPSTGTTGAITLAGTLGAANGGTGLTTPGTSGNVLTSNGSAWVSSAPSGGGVTSVTAGTGISVSASTGAVTITNTAPAISAGLAKAWVNFNGSGGSIRKSYNVSSVSVVGTGKYTINFTSALADANFVTAGTAHDVSNQSKPRFLGSYSKATSSNSISVSYQDGALIDATNVEVAMFN